jgi:hypothetical protein
MAFNINEIRSQLAHGGARPSHFQILVTNPINSLGDQKFAFTARAAQIPTWTTGVIPVFYFGRQIKVSGPRQFEPWNVTVYNDEDFLVRNALEQWSNAINTLQGNLQVTGSSSPAEYKSQGIITQYGKAGQVLRQYQFNGMWPSRVNAIEVDWTNGDAIEEFQVTFEFDEFEVIGGQTGNAGGV